MANILEFLWYKNTAYQIPLQSYPLYQNYLGLIINWLINFMDRGLPWTIQSIGIVFRICKTLRFIIIWQVHQWFQDIFFNDPSFGVKRSDFGEFASHECDYCFWMIHYRWKLSSTLSLLPALVIPSIAIKIAIHAEVLTYAGTGRGRLLLPSPTRSQPTQSWRRRTRWTPTSSACSPR